MSSQAFSYLLVAFCVVALAIGQIVFKFVGIRLASLTDLFTDVPALALLGIAVTLYAASTLAWIVALRTLPLTHAYTLMALGFILVPLTAHFLLGEPLTTRLIAGSVVIIAGILIAVT